MSYQLKGTVQIELDEFWAWAFKQNSDLEKNLHLPYTVKDFDWSDDLEITDFKGTLHYIDATEFNIFLLSYFPHNHETRISNIIFKEFGVTFEVVTCSENPEGWVDKPEWVK